MPLFATIFGRSRLAWPAMLIAMATIVALALVRPTTPPLDDLTIVGSRAMRLPVETWLDIYKERYPQSRVHAAMYGSGLAASAIADRRADAAPMTRELNSAERAILPAKSLPVAIPVGRQATASGANEPLFVYVARDPSGRAAPSALAFADVALSTRGQLAMMRAGFEPLPLNRRDDARARLSSLAGHPLDPNP